MKNGNKKSIAIAIIMVFTLLVSCLPLSEEQIYAKAEGMYTILEKPVEEEDNTYINLDKRDLADDQVLHLSGRFINNLDPVSADNTDDWIFTNQVYVGLTRQDMKTKEFLPALARGWDVSDDGKVWTFNLQEELPWVRYNAETGEVQPVRDGADNIHYVNSADVIAGLMRMLSPEFDSINKYNLFLIEGAEDYSMGLTDEISGIHIISGMEIEITLTEASGYLDAMTEMTAFSAYPAWPNMPVDSDDMEKILEYSYGPFVMQTYEPDQEITLIKNPYWKGTEGISAPYLEEVHYDLSEDQDVITQYQEGALDAVKLTAEEYDAVMEDPLLSKDIYTSQGSCGYYLVFKNIDNNALSSVTLRQAIAAAIDKEELASVLDGGTAQVLDQFVPVNVRGASDYPVDIGIAYDPESAKSDIEKADLDVDKLEEIQLLVPETDFYLEFAEDIALNLQEVLNINVVTSPEDWGGFFDEIWADSDLAMMYIIGNCLDYADAHSVWTIWDQEGSFSGIVSGEWQETEFHELLQEGAVTQASSQRQESYAMAEDIIINQDTVIVPLVSNSQLWLINPKLAVELSPLFPHLETWAFVK